MNYNPQSLHTWKRRRYFFFLFIPLIMLAIGAVVMYLWNAILPGVVHVGTITYWQAFGLLVLCRILFGGFHPRGGDKGHYFARSRAMKEKWMSMNEEEKQKFMEEWKSRCEHPGS